MKRAPGESFGEYRQRRKDRNIIEKSVGRFKRWFHQGGTYKRGEKKPAPKRTVISATVGKRHQGESIEDLKKRRKTCNHKRREKEKKIKWMKNIDIRGLPQLNS